MLTIEGIEIKFKFKKIRHIYLRIKEGGEVWISAPLRYWGPRGLSTEGKKIIHKFILAKKDWIHRRKEWLHRNPQSDEMKYRNGSHLYFFGKSLQLQVIKSPHQQCRLWLEDEIPILRIELSHPTPSRIKKIVLNWEKEELQKRIHSLCPKWEKMMGVQAQEYRIRRMRTRWGSCNPSAKRIWINLTLIEKPEVCLEYILVHELAHLLEPSHNHRFRSLMDHFLPSWKKYRKLLNTSISDITDNSSP